MGGMKYGFIRIAFQHNPYEHYRRSDDPGDVSSAWTVGKTDRELRGKVEGGMKYAFLWIAF